MSRTPLFDALKSYGKINRGYFRIPGHRFERGIPGDLIDFAGKNIFRLDLTETPLTDDLHNPESVIAESQRYTAEAFGAARSFYLVNGTTCGNESMIIASASEGEKILIPRNAHKSVMAGLVISGAQPVYMPVEYMPETGLTGVLKPETAKTLLAANPDAKAVFSVSPSYHGFCSDIKSLADTAHAAGLPLLVDEAHGAHLYFSDRLPNGAIKLGADACAQSMHKTGGSLTQSSLLHLRQEAEAGSYIDHTAVENALRITMSTSPSYLLMCSLETARHDLEENGEKYWSGTIELANELRKRIEEIPGFSCPSETQFRESGIFDLDPTRLIINCDYAAIGGYALKSLLWDKYSIDVEMADSRNILVILTYGNTVSDTENLVKALSDISAGYGTGSRIGHSGRDTDDEGRLPAVPEMILSPREAYFSKHRPIPWEDMRGQVIAEPIAPYPPGIPVIYPGEKVSDEIFDFLNMIKKKKIHLHGPTDRSLRTVKVCETV